MKSDTQKYVVTRPIDVDGTVYYIGAIAELDAETAKAYQHCIAPVSAKEETHADHS